MKSVRLKDLGRWYSGGTPPRAEEQHWSGRVPWLSAKDIDSTRLRKPTAFISEDAAHLYSRLVPTGSVLVIVRGMALAHGLPVVRTATLVAFNQDLRALVCGPAIDSRFARYALLGNRWRLDAHIDRAAHGTARVTERMFAERIQVPSLPAQASTADFLDRECARIDDLDSELGRLLNGQESFWTARLDDVVRNTPATSCRLRFLSTLITSGPRGWGDLDSDRVP